MLDEDPEVKEGAFQLLIIYLFTPKDMKSDEVNETLFNNNETLIENIEKNLDSVEDETSQKEKNEAIDWLKRLAMENV